MPLKSPRWPFSENLIHYSPEDWGGVYVLWKDDEVIHIGCAPHGETSLRAALLDHLEGRHGRCTQAATHYGWELSFKAEARERELVREYEAEHRRLPRCTQALAEQARA